MNSVPLASPPLPRRRAARRASTCRGSASRSGFDGRWQAAPEALEVAPGTLLRFRFALPRDHDVDWSGAAETRLTLRSSEARVAAPATGEHDVRVDVLDLDGHRLASVQTHVTVARAA